MPDAHSPPDSALPWLGLVIGNTRLHWAGFLDQELCGTWHTPHLSAAAVQDLVQAQFSAAAWQTLLGLGPEQLPPKGLRAVVDSSRRGPSPLPLYVASVVPQQTELWRSYLGCCEIGLDDIPLGSTYPTLGHDRALTLVGAGDRYGWPVLVIDAGTALTFTAGSSQALVGGAIVPGLALQFRALSATTASLPTVEPGDDLPERWPRSTPEAIRSGILYGTLATIRSFITDYRQQYPTGHVVFTGGDGARLFDWMKTASSLSDIDWDENLMFWGLRLCRCHRRATLRLS